MKIVDFGLNFYNVTLTTGLIQNVRKDLGIKIRYFDFHQVKKLDGVKRFLY